MTTINDNFAAFFLRKKNITKNLFIDVHSFEANEVLIHAVGDV